MGASLVLYAVISLPVASYFGQGVADSCNVNWQVRILCKLFKPLMIFAVQCCCLTHRNGARSSDVLRSTSVRCLLA
jgi:hypothetical protein